jgi:hypothetical protein
MPINFTVLWVQHTGKRLRWQRAFPLVDFESAPNRPNLLTAIVEHKRVLSEDLAGMRHEVELRRVTSLVVRRSADVCEDHMRRGASHRDADASIDLNPSALRTLLGKGEGDTSKPPLTVR